MIKIRRALPAAAVMLLIAVATPAIAASQPPSSGAADDPATTAASDDAEYLPRISAPEALAQDAAQLAKMEGISQTQAEAALIAGDKLRPITAQIRELVGTREVAIAKEYAPVTKLRVELSGTEQIPGLDRIARASGAPIEILYTDKLSVQQVIDALKSASDRWRKAFPQITRPPWTIATRAT